MLQFSNNDWILFQETKDTIAVTNSPPYNVCGDCIIIDNVLLFSHHISCVTRFFTKHRLSFKLSTCDLFQPGVEYVGHDITIHGYCPAVSKFNLLQS